MAGEKQVDRVVVFASYTYNTAEGGGIGATLSGQTAVGGLAYLRPFGVQGEVAVGFMWSQLIPGLLPTVERRSQSGVDDWEHRCHARLHVFAWGSVHLQPSI